MTESLPDAQLAILDAAEGLFARQGFAATTIKAIGTAAKLNPALLYYYYSDKAALYDAVIERRLQTFVGDMMSRIPPGMAALDAIDAIVRGQIAMFRSAPQMARLITRELADHAAAHATPVIRQRLTVLFQRVTEVMRAGQARGEIRADLDPRFAAISTIAQAAWFFVAHPIVIELLNRPRGVPPEEIERFALHVVSFTRAALTPMTPTPRPT